MAVPVTKVRGHAMEWVEKEHSPPTMVPLKVEYFSNNRVIDDLASWAVDPPERPGAVLA